MSKEGQREELLVVFSWFWLDVVLGPDLNYCRGAREQQKADTRRHHFVNSEYIYTLLAF